MNYELGIRSLNSKAYRRGKGNKRGQKKERFTKANLSKQKYVGKNYSSFNVTRLKAVAVKFLETEAMY